ncbi:phage holin family protein [Sandarakinorhabdus sp. AAP62]|uniref:phage holin family protein n=1 Tax=Sandarakinorhabdus sp. AAP62 TaxID=1248916 RepID=UPI0002F18F9E|nr:phage holin family protein [Sandarakinorhabdus sp. AAP62]
MIGSGLAAQARHLVGGFLLLMQTLSRLTAAELRANAGALRTPLLLLLLASGLLFTAVTLLLVAAVWGLAQFVGPIMACLIVAFVAIVAAWALARHSLSRLAAVDLAPRRSMATLQAQIDRFAARKPAHPKEPRP